MRVATFLSVAAIAAVTTIGPALAYGPAASGPSLSYLTSGPEAASPKVANQQTQVAFAIIKMGTNGYVLVKGDNGKEFPNCHKRANCSMEIYEYEFDRIVVDCKTAKGCLIIGKE